MKLSRKAKAQKRMNAKLRRVKSGAAFNNLPIELRKATLEASLPSLGLSQADLSAAPDHCRTVFDVYMWKMDLPRDVAEARLAEILQGTSQDEADRVLAPFGL